MRIGIDVRMWRESGIGRYIRNLVRQLVVLDTQNEYVLFGLDSDRDAILELIRVGQRRWKFVSANFRWYSVTEQLGMPTLLNNEHLDLMHFPHFNVPILYSKPFVVTIHDMTHYQFSMQRASTLPPFLYGVKHTAYSFVFEQALRRSKQVLTISQYVKNALIQRFDIADSKLTVSYEAVDDSLSRFASSHINVSSSPYFLYVGNAHPHKNLELLLEGFQKFRAAHPEYCLMLVGKKNYFWEQVEQFATERNIVTNVVFKGYVDDSELASLYSHAAAYVFPSLSEGFGLPLLEAMQQECPVISSSATCLPEIAGDAALYFDPLSVDSLVEAMNKIVQDSDVSRQLIERGKKQVQKFNWRDTADATLKIYTSV